MEVHVGLRDRGDLAAQIYRQRLETVLDGRLRPGERLPSTRDVARRLGVSRNTAATAYDRLARGGCARSRRPPACICDVGVCVDPVAAYCDTRPAQQGLVIGYGGIRTADIEEGLRRLANSFGG